jgi:hypothetical protein
MNATSSGVASSAAKMRSPSFSRSSSSTTTTALPAAMSAIARSMLSSPVTGGGTARAGRSCAPPGAPGRADPGAQQLLDVLGHDVDLQVDRVADARAPSVVAASVVGDEAHLEPVVATALTVSETPSTVMEPFSTT